MVEHPELIASPLAPNIFSVSTGEVKCDAAAKLAKPKKKIEYIPDGDGYERARGGRGSYCDGRTISKEGSVIKSISLLDDSRKELQMEA